VSISNKNWDYLHIIQYHFGWLDIDTKMLDHNYQNNNNCYTTF